MRRYQQGEERYIILQPWLDASLCSFLTACIVEITLAKYVRSVFHPASLGQVKYCETMQVIAGLLIAVEAKQAGTVFVPSSGCCCVCRSILKDV